MKKYLFLVVLIIICSGCDYKELDDLSIVTAMSISNQEDKYEISVLVSNSQKNGVSNKEGEASTTVYSSVSDNITDALTLINNQNQKSIYLGHLKVVLVSQDLAKKGIFNLNDYFLRNPEVKTNFYIALTENDPKDVLSIVSPLEGFPSQNISSLIKNSNNSIKMGKNITYNDFTKDTISEGINPTLINLSVIGDSKTGSSESNITSTIPSAYINVDSLAIFNNDKFISTLSDEETKVINLLKNNASTININTNNITSELYNLNSCIKYKNDNFFIRVKGDANIKEINNKINPIKYRNYIEKSIEKYIKLNINKTIYNMQNKYKSDAIGFGNLIYKYDNKKWKKIKNNWDSKKFKNINYDLNVSINVKNFGAIKGSIKESL